MSTACPRKIYEKGGSGGGEAPPRKSDLSPIETGSWQGVMSCQGVEGAPGDMMAAISNLIGKPSPPTPRVGRKRMEGVRIGCAKKCASSSSEDTSLHFFLSPA